MSSHAAASEATKNALENSVNWFLGDKLQDPATPIATKKYLTPDNLLVYLTHCNVAELSVPRIKVQVFERVKGGVKETGYQLYSDHRFERYRDHMIFGTQPGTGNEAAEEVSEAEASGLVQLVNSLANARQTL